LGAYGLEAEDDEHESFKIQRKKKDPYAEEEWDPRSAIKGKVKKEQMVKPEPQEGSDSLHKVQSGWRREIGDEQEIVTGDRSNEVKLEPKPEGVTPMEKPDVAPETKPEVGLFKKRRPPPSSRKM
jgi:hypothetical protein